MSSVARKRTAPHAPGHEQSGQLGSSSQTLTRRQRKPAIGYTSALAMTPANDTGLYGARDRRVIDLSLAELIDELCAALPPTSEAREILSSEEAADLLRCSVSTLWRLVRNGHVRARLIGGSRRYVRRELLEFVERAPIAVPEVPNA